MSVVEYEGNIGLVGFSGSGKSTLGQALREELRWDEPVIDVGIMYFRPLLEAAGLSVQEGDKIPLSLDRMVDSNTVKVLKNDSKRILVGRMMSYLSLTLNLGENRYFGVSVKCRKTELVKRAREGWNRKKNLQKDTPLPSTSYVESKIDLRNKLDLARLGKVHGVESHQDLYGKPPNNIVLWSHRMTIYEEVDAVISRLRALSCLGVFESSGELVR